LEEETGKSKIETRKSKIGIGNWQCPHISAIPLETRNAIASAWHPKSVRFHQFRLSSFDFRISSFYFPISSFHFPRTARRAATSTKSGEGASSSTNPSVRAWVAGTRSAVSKSCVAAALPIKRVSR
jgi:hypothetical protein